MFGEKKTENNMINIHINNSQICQKDEVKYLGIVIDKNLKWKPHIDKLTTQISQSVGLLYHLKKYLSFNNLKLVYHALIKSRLQYGIPYILADRSHHRIGRTISFVLKKV